MYTLFIDTHLYDIIVILLKDGVCVDKREVINKQNNSIYLFPTIVDLIDGITLGEIIVVNGPGSFTSTRLGITIAKTLAYTLNIPIKTITSLEVMALSNNSLDVAISDANGYYTASFDNNYKIIEEYNYVKELDDKKYDLNYNIDISKIYKYMENKEPIDPHLVNPIYVKKIGVEID